MQIKGKYSWVKHLDFMAVDLGALLLSFFLSYYLKFNSLYFGVEWKRLLAIITLLNILINLLGNPYSGILRRRYYQEIGRSFLVVASNAFCAVMIFYILKIGADYSREVVIVTYVLYFFLTVLLKYIWKKLLTSGAIHKLRTQKTALFLISQEENAKKDILSVYSSDLQLYDIRGIHLLSDSTEVPSSISCKSSGKSVDVPVVQNEFVEYILDNHINEVLVCAPLQKLDSGVCQKLLVNGVGVNVVVEAMLGLQTEEQFVFNIGINRALHIGTFSFSPSQNFYLIIKRLFDIFCGLLGLVILIPMTLLVKFAYLLSGDTAGIIYRQRRVGLNGKIIRIWKYRSMVPNADEILPELLKDEKYQKEWTEKQKLENDPRITGVGIFLRNASLDELPQMLNVLRGDMSMVGPRPLVEGELEAHGGLKLYEKVKPGITGWWACNGRSNIDYRERLELEYYYIKNCSLYLDILCIIRTIWAVLKKDGVQ